MSKKYLQLAKEGEEDHFPNPSLFALGVGERKGLRNTYFFPFPGREKARRNVVNSRPRRGGGKEGGMEEEKQLLSLHLSLRHKNSITERTRDLAAAQQLVDLN